MISESCAAPRSTLRASPRAKALAASRGISLAGLKGTGPAGRILERDVKAAAIPPAPQGARREAPPGTPSAANVTLTMTSFADAREAQALRRKLAESPLETGLREIGIGDIVLYAASRALLHHPALNGRITDGALEHADGIDLGFITDSPRGPLAPVVRGAHRLSLSALARERSRLAALCREGIITPEELASPTFVVLDCSGTPVEMLSPMLVPGQPAALGVGAIALKPVPGPDGTAAQVPSICLSLAFNGQLVTGATGAGFLETLAGMLAHIELVMAG